MEIKIYSEVPIDKNFEEYLKTKVEKLKKFIFDEGKVNIYIRKERAEYISEISVHSKHMMIFLKEKENDLNKSLNKLFDKIKMQLKKKHDKIIDISHK